MNHSEAMLSFIFKVRDVQHCDSDCAFPLCLAGSQGFSAHLSIFCQSVSAHVMVHPKLADAVRKFNGRQCFASSHAIAKRQWMVDVMRFKQYPWAAAMTLVETFLPESSIQVWSKRGWESQALVTRRILKKISEFLGWISVNLCSTKLAYLWLMRWLCGCATIAIIRWSEKGCHSLCPNLQAVWTSESGCHEHHVTVLKFAELSVCCLRLTGHLDSHMWTWEWFWTLSQLSKQKESMINFD